MATDMFGKPIGASPEVKLNLQQKRQASLLYHWMSLDYLKGLLTMIEALIKGADVSLELAKQQGRDALLKDVRWGVRDTSANWATHVFPALEDFKRSTLKDIALRATESYEFTGANQCAHMISEFSSMWMTEDEEQRFREQFDKLCHYAQFIDFAAGVGGRRHQLHDYSMSVYWLEHAHLFPRLPKFRVRTDVEGVSGKRPVRTGVYVAQDDEFATLQFAWVGNEDGLLGESETLNDFGRRAIGVLGRDHAWGESQPVADFIAKAFKRGDVADLGGFPSGSEREAELAGIILSINARTTRPCKWYFVEKIEGEFEDTEMTSTSVTGSIERLRCQSGDRCPRQGFWSTPARTDSRRHFQQGETMPEVGGDYGTTIWQWDDRQD